MIKQSIAALLCLGLLAACDGGNPLISPSDDTTDSGTTDGSTGDGGDPINSTAQLPPGTASVTTVTTYYAPAGCWWARS